MAALGNKYYIIVPTTVVYVVFALKFLARYMHLGLPLYIGLAILPFTFQVSIQTYSNRYLLPALIFAALAFFIPAQSTVYFSLVFTSLLLFENFKGKINLNVLLVLIIISPLFKFFSNTLGFPLRLWLSNVVAQIMTFVGMHAKSAGNIIYIDHYEFYIDHACAGLNMLNVSLLLGIFILSIQQKKEGRSLNIFQTGILLSLIFLLNICSNLSRILLIVIFKIMPGTPMHDFVGLLSMIIYVLMPLIYYSNSIIKRFGKVDNIIRKDYSPTVISNPVLQLGLILLLGMAILGPKKPSMQNPATANNIDLQGYRKTKLDDAVLKFENQEAIIYMKPTPFYAPEHNPMMCWTGSGYEFKFIQKQTFKGIEIYTGTLEKGKDKLYAAWWFDNGTLKTINQLKWRWNEASGKSGFYLVNVNTARKEDLKKIVESIL